MAFRIPSKDALRDIGTRLGMDIDEDYANHALAVLSGSVASFRLIEQLLSDAESLIGSIRT